MFSRLNQKTTLSAVDVYLKANLVGPSLLLVRTSRIGFRRLTEKEKKQKKLISLHKVLEQQTPLAVSFYELYRENVNLFCFSKSNEDCQAAKLLLYKDTRSKDR